jgi:hypothetical protein
MLDSYNAVYKLYYKKVVVDKNGAGRVQPTDITDKNLCTTAGGTQNYCPDGSDPSKALNGEFLDDDKINVTYNSLKKYLDDCAKNIDPTDDYYRDNITKKTDVDNNYKTLKNTRNDLDMKMKEILANDQSIFREDQNYIDGSVYTTLLWTVLATSLIYYTFTKI